MRENKTKCNVNCKCPKYAAVHNVFTHEGENSQDEVFSEYSACVCHHGGKTASLQNSSDTHHSLQKALD